MSSTGKSSIDNEKSKPLGRSLDTHETELSRANRKIKIQSREIAKLRQTVSELVESLESIHQASDRSKDLILRVKKEASLGDTVVSQKCGRESSRDRTSKDHPAEIEVPYGSGQPSIVESANDDDRSDIDAADRIPESNATEGHVQSVRHSSSAAENQSTSGGVLVEHRNARMIEKVRGVRNREATTTSQRPLQRSDEAGSLIKDSRVSLDKKDDHPSSEDDGSNSDIMSDRSIFLTAFIGQEERQERRDREFLAHRERCNIYLQQNSQIKHGSHTRADFETRASRRSQWVQAWLATKEPPTPSNNPPAQTEQSFAPPVTGLGSGSGKSSLPAARPRTEASKGSSRKPAKDITTTTTPVRGLRPPHAKLGPAWHERN